MGVFVPIECTEANIPTFLANLATPVIPKGTDTGDVRFCVSTGFQGRNGAAALSRQLEENGAGKTGYQSLGVEKTFAAEKKPLFDYQLLQL